MPVTINLTYKFEWSCEGLLPHLELVDTDKATFPGIIGKVDEDVLPGTYILYFTRKTYWGGSLKAIETVTRTLIVDVPEGWGPIIYDNSFEATVDETLIPPYEIKGKNIEVNFNLVANLTS